MSLSVIVAVDNRPQMLTYFFDQLTSSLKPGEDEMIVVSDACWDARVLKDLKRLARSNGFVRLIQLNEKVGFGCANNIGVRAAMSDTLVFVNTDVFPDAGAVHTLADELQTDPSIGAVQGLLVYPQTYRVQSTGHIFSEYLNFHALEGRAADHPLVLRRQQRQALTSAFYAIRKDTFARFGGFDEFYFNAWEGMELTLRFSHAGMQCIYTPNARAFHVRGGGRRHSPLDETQQIGYFWAKWGSRIRNDLVTLLAEQLTTENLRARYFAINCGSTSTWKALIDQLGLSVQGHIQVPDRFESHVCLYDNVSRAVLVHASPLLFLADHFEQLAGNRAWFHSRENRGDLVIDRRGNVLPIEELI